MTLRHYYHDGAVTIYHGDAREVLVALGNQEPWDLLLTDPPYGHGREGWSGGTWAAAPMYEEVRDWDQATAGDALGLALARTKQAIVWGGNYYALPPSRCWLAWMKPEGMETLADFELAWTSLDRPALAFRQPRNPDGRRVHPTQKPLQLFQWCLGLVPEASTVLDPFMGSGTTLVAAKALGRRAVGVELVERYCEEAAKRLTQEVLAL